MSSLLGIPLELLVGVSEHLPTSDLGALRLTCKQVEKSLYEWFADEFFTKKQVRKHRHEQYHVVWLTS